MSTILEEAVRRYEIPFWGVLAIGIGIGIGIAAVTVLVAAIGVAASLAGNSALPEVLALWQQ